VYVYLSVSRITEKLVEEFLTWRVGFRTIEKPFAFGADPAYDLVQEF